MPRHTSFRFCLDLSVEQERVLSQHVGAARFAFNQALRLHEDARAAAESQREQDPTPAVAAAVLPDGDRPGDGHVSGATRVPWTGFDLINAFNAWKRSGAAGRRFVVDATGMARAEVTGLVWRHRVLAQVFEEACVDLGRGLKAATDSRTGARKGPKVGFPRFKKKSPMGGSFRIRNVVGKGRASIRLGDGSRVRSVSLPKIGVLKVPECTRRLRRMIATGRARILHVTVSRGASRWWISITVEAADLHPAARHASQPVEAGKGNPRPAGKGWVGVVCTPWPSPARPTAARCCGSTTSAPSGAASRDYAACPRPCHARRGDRRTARRLSCVWDGSMPGSVTVVAMCCIRCPPSWSRTTPGWSWKT